MERLTIVLLAAALAGECSARCADVKLLGHFTNFQWTNDEDPHLESGFSVNLFRCQKNLFGEVSVANGSLEPSGGRLYDILFDARTGKLSFKAKYSDGEELSRATGPQGRETRKILSFSGTLSKRLLKGVFVIQDGYNDEPPAKFKPQVLPRESDYTVPKSQEEFENENPFSGW